jgi:probable HAF family extracellular repeat protein
VKRTTVFTLLVTAATLVGGVWACTDSSAPTPPPPPPSPALPVHFAILPAVDTVMIGDSVTFFAQGADSSVDQWTVSDSGVVRIAEHQHNWARVGTRFDTGWVTITATRQNGSGQAMLLVVPSLRIGPLPDSVTVGTLLLVEAYGWNLGSVHWSLSDSSMATITAARETRASVLTRTAGTLTIRVSYGGATARATVVVREPRPGEFEAIDLGLLGASQGYAFAIGDDGSVVGRLDTPGMKTRGFVYKNGTMHALPSSGFDEWPMLVGPAGQIAGIASIQYSSTSHAVIWDAPDAAPRLLDENVSSVIGINEHGDVLLAGWYGDPTKGLASRGVLWRNNVPVDLGSLSDSTIVTPSTYVKAWNSRGQIVGSSEVTQVADTTNARLTRVQHPFIWENGVMRDLGVLEPFPCTNVATPANCAHGQALDINVHGVVVGEVSDARGFTRAFLWENGVMRDLGFGPNSEAIAINDRGQVLVTVGNHAYLWENGQTQSVSFEGILSALGPNGEVIGSARGANFLWQAGQRLQLGPGEPRALNGHGEVVGWQGCCYDTRPVIWRIKSP